MEPIDVTELRLQWTALRDEDLSGLPHGALVASIRDLAGELLARTEPTERRTDTT